MKLSRKVIRIGSVTMGLAICMGAVPLASGCSNSTDALVIMTDALNGLFNPFFSTTGTDVDVVGQTQISMLGTDSDANVAYGEDEAVVVLDYKTEYSNSADTTTYYFVLKNDILFSDGVPLTMNDVLFNMYVYLDPAYTGSNTMYSTDIVGLSSYRTQTSSSDSSSADDALTTTANTYATNRRRELVNVFRDTGEKYGSSTSYYATEENMRTAIAEWTCTEGYLESIGVETQAEGRAQLLADYEEVLKLFKEELETDYDSAQESYTEDPYKSSTAFDESDEILCFMMYEGYVTINYALVAGSGYDKNTIESIEKNYSSSITTKDEAIKYVYQAVTESSLDQILLYWATGTTVLNNYVAKAKDVILHANLTGDELVYKSISGITSMGHDSSESETSVTIGSNTYTIAQEHNDDGTVKNSNEYDVLKIVINGIDPKAIWNFAFTVAPFHYYANDNESGDTYTVDIENEEYGVDWSSYDYMSNILQGNTSAGVSKNKVPVGAGPYAASDSDNNDNPTANGFYNDNTVYYKANENFLMGAPKIEKMRYRYVSSSNALGALQSGEVHYAEPQYTADNYSTLQSLKSSGIEYTATWQLGYGYVGINAGKVTSVYLRRAIMAAMNTSLAIQYYNTGTAVNIAWPMSVVSWAYPRTSGTSFDSSNPTANMETNNGHSYTQYNASTVYDTVKSYMTQAGVSAGDSSLKIKFTIAGSNMTEHPLYNTFIGAMEILNECGWEITVVPDTNALTKLSTGSLSVWAAAWSSTIDPDMYQVYHKDSTATSVLAWGYREILADKSTYSYENGILDSLSEVIELARETDDQDTRAAYYKTAMSYVLDLSVELPVYQRQVLYAYNANVIDSSTLPENINSYSSPLERIWEIDFVK